MSDSITAHPSRDPAWGSKVAASGPNPPQDMLESIRQRLQGLLPQISSKYQAKFDASDIIQQTMLEACERYEDYQGSTDAELNGWLRQMLSHNLLDAVRRLRSQKRDIARERRSQSLAGSASGHFQIAGSMTSPSRHAVRHEELDRVTAAIDRLPENQQRAVSLHHLEGKTLAEIAKEMACSRGAVAGLLHRGLRTVQAEMGES